MAKSWGKNINVNVKKTVKNCHNILMINNHNKLLNEKT